MNVGQTKATRDLALSEPLPAPVITAQPVAPAEAGKQDNFGPATRVAISSSDQQPVRVAAARPASEAVEKVISVDTQTKSLVFQDLNQVTGAVVSQFPDEAKLRLRAYLDELSQQQTQSATAGTHLDPSAIDGIRV